MKLNSSTKFITKSNVYAFAASIVLSLYVNNLLTKDEYDNILEDLKDRYNIKH